MRFKLIATLALACVLVVLWWTPILAAGPTSAPSTPHTLAGRADCAMCHRAGGAGVGAPGGTGMPSNHEGRTNDTCVGCHPAGSAANSPAETAAPKPTATTAAPKPTAATTAAASSVAQAAPQSASGGGSVPASSSKAGASTEASALPSAGEQEDRVIVAMIALVGAAGLLGVGFGMHKLWPSSK